MPSKVHRRIYWIGWLPILPFGRHFNRNESFEPITPIHTKNYIPNMGSSSQTYRICRPNAILSTNSSIELKGPSLALSRRLIISRKKERKQYRSIKMN
jgi:hypothetical protein